MAEREPSELAARLRPELERLAATRTTISYRDLATRAQLEPPGVIRRLAAALEHLMEEDAAADRPFLAAVVVSRARPGLPAPGFFERAVALGRFAPGENIAEQGRQHGAELQRLYSHYRPG